MLKHRFDSLISSLFVYELFFMDADFFFFPRQFGVKSAHFIKLKQKKTSFKILV